MNHQSAVPYRGQRRSFLLLPVLGNLDERFCPVYESSICRAVSMADAKFSAVGCALAISMSALPGSMNRQSAVPSRWQMRSFLLLPVLGYLDERICPVGMNRQSAVPSRWQMRSFLLWLCFGYLDERPLPGEDESSICRAVSMADAKFSAVACALAISMSAFARMGMNRQSAVPSRWQMRSFLLLPVLGYLDERIAR
jgi:hypothetical protein